MGHEVVKNETRVYWAHLMADFKFNEQPALVAVVKRLIYKS
jgi:hypothetical protein